MDIFRHTYQLIANIILEKVQKNRLFAIGVQSVYCTDLIAPIIYNMITERVDKLKKGLDEQSIDCLNYSIRHMVEALTIQYINPGDLSKEQRENIDKYKQEQKKYAEFYLKPRKYLPEVFYYHHGLRFCSEKIRKYVANKNFLDCGAYIGDSAIVLSRYSPKQILCYEFVESTIKLFHQNIFKNHLTEMVSLQSYALGNVANTASSYTGSGAGFSIMNNPAEKRNYSSVPFEIKRMDDCISRDTPIGFIKADVEGALLDVLMGGRETIIKNRPVLSLAVYHSPTELFESKPYLESILKDYVYEYHHFNFSTKFQSELNLFAYPGEILS